MTPDDPLPPRSGAAGWLNAKERSSVQVVLLFVIAAVVVIAALDHASGIAVPTVLAVLAAIALAPLVKRLESLHAPPSLAAALIVAGVLFSSLFAIYALLPSAEAWNDRAPQVIREIEQRVRQFNASISEAISILPKPEDPIQTTASPPAEKENPDQNETNGAGDALTKLVDGGQNMVADWVISTPGIVAAAVYWAVLTFFLLRDRAMLGRKLMAAGVGLPAKRALARAMADVQSNVGRYLLSITLINIVLGFSVAVTFYMFGVPNAALWGVAAGLLNFMPYIGAAIMAIITLAVGLVSFADPIVTFFLLAALVTLNTIEGQVATPLIVGAQIRLPAIAIFVAIAFGAWLWGAVGALVATPILIVTNAFVTRLTAVRKAPPPMLSGGAARPAFLRSFWRRPARL